MNRATLLKLVAGAAVGLFLLDRLVLTPATAAWSEQGERIAALEKRVTSGETLLGRAESIRRRWTGMRRANLPADDSAAENEAFKAIGKWVRGGGVIISNLTPNPQWQTHPEGYETYEVRAVVIGDQASLGRFLYELETDSIPVSLEECELATRDVRGAQLTMTARLSFARITATGPATATPVRGRATP